MIPYIELTLCLIQIVWQLLPPGPVGMAVEAAIKTAIGLRKQLFGFFQGLHTVGKLAQSLHITFHGLFSDGKFSTKPLQI